MGIARGVHRRQHVVPGPQEPVGVGVAEFVKGLGGDPTDGRCHAGAAGSGNDSGHMGAMAVVVIGQLPAVNHIQPTEAGGLTPPAVPEVGMGIVHSGIDDAHHHSFPADPLPVQGRNAQHLQIPGTGCLGAGDFAPCSGNAGIGQDGLNVAAPGQGGNQGGMDLGRDEVDDIKFLIFLARPAQAAVLRMASNSF